MIAIGSIALGIAVAATIMALRPSSRVEHWLGAFDGHARDAGPRRRFDPLVAARIAGALCGATVGALAAWVVGGGVVPIVAFTYAGAVGPALVRDRRDGARVRDAERACVTSVEWLCALVAAGRPIESAMMRIAGRAGQGTLLDEALARVRRDYTLGVPLHVAVVREGASSGIRGLADLGARLERARALGRGAAPLLDDLRNDLRAAERARALRAASGVEGKLTLVMTLCYLPALALLVIVPLFLTLLSGLFG